MRTRSNYSTQIICLLSIFSFGIFINPSYGADNDKKLKNGFSWIIESKMTYDSNVYRAPDDSTYKDFGDSCTPPVIPDPNDLCTPDGYTNVSSTVKDGAFIVLNVKPNYKKQISRNNSLEVKAKINSQTYIDSAHSDANTSKYSIEIGENLILNRRKTKRDSVYVGFFTGKINKKYLDRDTGNRKEFSNTDISDRYTYNSSGVNVKYKLRTTKYKYDFVLKFKNNNYVDILGPSEMVYDNTYYLLGAKVKIPLKGKMKLHIDYNFYNYTYDHDIDVRRFRVQDTGKLTNTGKTSARKYDYHRIKFTLRKRYSKKWLSHFDYEYTNRIDQVQGYDNYQKNKLKVRITHDASSKVKLKYTLSLWQRDYQYGLAFDNIASGKIKEYDGQELRLSAFLFATKKSNYIVDFRYRNDDSTDLRYDYDRIKFSLGIEWES